MAPTPDPEVTEPEDKLELQRDLPAPQAAR